MSVHILFSCGGGSVGLCVRVCVCEMSVIMVNCCHEVGWYQNVQLLLQVCLSSKCSVFVTSTRYSKVTLMAGEHGRKPPIWGYVQQALSQSTDSVC